MSHWFHRNTLKPTKWAKYELKAVLTNDATSKICSELRLRRDKFLEHLLSASTDLETVETEFNAYLGLLYGFLFEIGTERKDVNSKLRYLERFTWGGSVQDGEALEYNDSWFEALSICTNFALWYMKRAAWISGKDEVLENDAKQIHTALRKAAGIFQYVMENVEKLSSMGNFPGSDVDRNVLSAYITQCTAEAQEITIARAIELKHTPKLISALAAETARAYQKCDKLIENMDPVNFEKWRNYFQLKHQFYLSYAYAYLGESLLAEDKCGLAVRTCKEGITCYHLAEDLCAKYAKASGPGFIAQPEKHLFFRRVEPMLKRHLEKAERENGMIYHEKVPDECPPLTEEAAYGLAKAEPFTYPAQAESWTIVNYAAFDIAKAIMPDFSKAKKASKLPPVKEEKVYETDKDPRNRSGCTIS